MFYLLLFLGLFVFVISLVFISIGLQEVYEKFIKDVALEVVKQLKSD